MLSSFRGWVLVVMCGCQFHPPSGEAIDGALGDVIRIDGAIDAPDNDTRHLLLTEIGSTPPEFIEIFNPKAIDVDLTSYYLSDYNEYWKLPGHVAGTSPIAPADSDFLVKFPAGSRIRAGGVIVVAIDGDAFQVAFAAPDFTIFVPFSSVPQMTVMVTSGNPQPSITNTGEMVALFEWDGASDTVKDVDLVVTGTGLLTSNAPVAKVPVDGPDGDSSATPYLADVLTIGEMTGSATNGQSYKRIALEGAQEIATGGNGITGHDETSENERMTWDNGTSNPTPGVVPALP